MSARVVVKSHKTRLKQKLSPVDTRTLIRDHSNMSIVSQQPSTWETFDCDTSPVRLWSVDKNLSHHDLLTKTVKHDDDCEGDSKYSVFDSVRLLEQSGGDLGWSRELLRGVDGA